MRVLLLSDGSSFHTAKWIKAYQDNGVDVLCLSLEQPRSDLPGQCVWIKPRFGKKQLDYLWAVSTVSRLAKDFGATVINAHMATGYGLVGALALRGQKLVVSLWGPDILESPKRGPGHKGVLRFVFNKAHMIHTDALVANNILIREFGVPKNKIYHMVFGLQPDVLERPLREIKAGPPWRVMTHRKLEPIYGPENLVQAVRLLVNKGLDLSLTFASGGSMFEYLREKARGLPVKITGWLEQDQLWEQISRAHIFVSASLSDTTPVSLLEAMALGAVPAVSDLPANSQWVVSGLNGAMFQATNPTDIARAIMFLVENPKFLQQARLLNKQLVMQRANWEEDFRDFLRAVNQLPHRPTRLHRPRAWLPWNYIEP